MLRKTEQRGLNEDGDVVGKQVIGVIAMEQRRSEQRDRRVVIGAFGVMLVTFGITYARVTFSSEILEWLNSS